MNKKQYKEKRNKLLNQAKQLLEDGKLKESEEIMKEIEELDANFNAMATAQANFNTLNDANRGGTDITSTLFSGGQSLISGKGIIAPSVPASEYQTPDGREIKVYRKGNPLSATYPNNEGLNLGKYLKGAITGDWTGAKMEMNEFKALSTATTQVLIPQVLSSQVIDMARNISVLFQSGVPMIPMETNNLTISRVKQDPAFAFKPEGEETQESDMEFEGVELKTKTAYGLMSITIEAMNSSANLETVVAQAMAESLARLIDYKLLFGAGADADEPQGILTYSTINEQPAGDSLENYEPFVRAIGKIRQSNGEPTAWVLNATTDEHLNLLTDANGNPLIIPPVLNGLERLVSNQLPADGGTDGDESVSMIYNPEAILIGLQLPLSVEVSREALDAWKKGLVYLRVYAMVDVALLRPKWVTKISGIKQAIAV